MIRAIQERTNSQLLADCQTLGYLPRDLAFALDCTFGLGGMWRGWEERAVARLTKTDLEPRGVDVQRASFTELPFDDGTFASVVFDPPYKLNGTSTGKGPAASDDRYGVTEYRSVHEKHTLIIDGIAECARVLAPSGFLLLKCQDQVCSGRVHWQTRIFADYAERMHDMRLVDSLLVPGMRKQPEGRSQKHARRNYSTLLILKNSS